ncbi:MAG: HEPN domain-containing protein [Cellulosilyticaceae bacterium]
MNVNSYYAIACNDIAYLEAIGDTGYYNQPAALCQQIVEKLLKSIIEQVYIEDNLMDILRSHSLKTLGRALKSTLPQIQLDIKDLTYLTNYYYDTRYPGPDYHLVTKEDYEECKRIMYDVKEEIDELQKDLQ